MAKKAKKNRKTTLTEVILTTVAFLLALVFMLGGNVHYFLYNNLSPHLHFCLHNYCWLFGLIWLVFALVGLVYMFREEKMHWLWGAGFAVVLIIGVILMNVVNCETINQGIQGTSGASGTSGGSPIGNPVPSDLPVTTCTDTDGGMKPETKGKIVEVPIWDKCSNDYVLKEYVCIGSKQYGSYQLDCRDYFHSPYACCSDAVCTMHCDGIDSGDRYYCCYAMGVNSCYQGGCPPAGVQIGVYSSLAACQSGCSSGGHVECSKSTFPSCGGYCSSGYICNSLPYVGGGGHCVCLPEVDNGEDPDSGNCHDGVDNDGDGYTDCDDPQCDCSYTCSTSPYPTCGGTCAVGQTCIAKSYTWGNVCQCISDEQLCVDSDNGDRPIVPGTVTTAGGATQTDYCMSNARDLVEYACIGTAPIGKLYSCGSVCTNCCCVQGKSGGYCADSPFCGLV